MILKVSYWSFNTGEHPAKRDGFLSSTPSCSTGCPKAAKKRPTGLWRSPKTNSTALSSRVARLTHTSHVHCSANSTLKSRFPQNRPNRMKTTKSQRPSATTPPASKKHSSVKIYFIVSSKTLSPQPTRRATSARSWQEEKSKSTRSYFKCWPLSAERVKSVA